MSPHTLQSKSEKSMTTLLSGQSSCERVNRSLSVPNSDRTARGVSDQSLGGLDECGLVGAGNVLSQSMMVAVGSVQGEE